MSMLLFIFFNSALSAIGLLLAVIGACGVTHFFTLRGVRWEIEVMRAEFSDRIATALDEVEHLTEKSGAAVKPAGISETPKPAMVAKPAPVAQPPGPVAKPEPTAEEVAHETLVVIAAAVSAFLGKSVRLRSARLIHPAEGNPWAQQGRVFVQASHNLGLAHHA